MKVALTLTAAVLGAAIFASLAIAEAPVTGSTRPDDRAGIRGPGSVVDAVPVRPDDRAGVRGPVASSSSSDGPVAPVSRPSFNWGDAGIGAAAGAGLVLLLIGFALLIRSARREPQPA